MNLVLQILEPGKKPRRLQIYAPGGVIGGSSDADFQIDEISISSAHAKVWSDPVGDWWIQDLDSTNGTFLNHSPLEEPKKLQSGDTLELGSLKIEVDLEAGKGVKELPALALGKVKDSYRKSGVRFRLNDPQSYLDLLFFVLASIHGFLARYLPKAIGFGVRQQNRLPLQLRMMLGFLLLAGISAWAGWRALPSYYEWTSYSDEYIEILRDHHLIASGERVAALGRVTCYVLLFVAFAAWLRVKGTLLFFKAGLALFLLLWFYLHLFYTQVPALLNDVDYKQFDNFMRNEYWLRSWMPWLPALIPFGVMTLAVALRPVWNFYGKQEISEPLPGDQVVKSLQSGGRDPRMRSSSYWAGFVTFFVLALPFIIRGCGWEDPYGLIKGSGDPVVEMVQVTRQREIPERRLIVNNWSPFIFERMEIDDIQILDEIEEMTLDTYEIAQEQTGKLGEGGGDTGGWPEGMEGATVRFIRLQYSGGDWDQNMDRNSDANLLRRFRQITGFPVASDGEARRVDRLRRFPEGLKPPFVFMTGRGNVNFTASEIRTLRWYTLEEGGMIFATHGGGNFDRNFRNQLNRIFPGSRLVDIPNDDPIYRAPFIFPNGAPPLWQQAGNRSLGIRHEGRWVVFYHPGDMSDAWRDGHNNAPPEVAEQAYRMAVNVMYYAFNMYYARHH